jgi:hypothetical protein
VYTTLPPPEDQDAVGELSEVAATSTVVRTNLGVSPDYNDNGVVDAADYPIWRNSFGQVAFGLPADGNGNGRIDVGDYLIWKMNYGLVVPGSGSGGGSASRVVPDPGGSPVPEPASGLLLAGAMGVLFSRPRKPFLRQVNGP